MTFNDRSLPHYGARLGKAVAIASWMAKQVVAGFALSTLAMHPEFLTLLHEGGEGSDPARGKRS
jgi:hypothetical protein